MTRDTMAAGASHSDQAGSRRQHTSKWRRTAIALSVAVLASQVLTHGSAFALHSSASPPTYWDCNVDGFADDTCVKGYKAGAGWGGDANGRLTGAFNAWINGTDFDPQQSTTGQPIYKVDHSTCLAASWTSYPGILAVVCLTKQWRLDSYYRILSSPTYVNPNHNWWYGSAAPPNDTYRDFGGLMTHELGHWVFLKDLACSPGVTMCNQLGGGTVSYNARSLEQDDKDGANAVYP